MICDELTGAAVSIGTDIAEHLPIGLVAVSLSNEDAGAYLCSEATWSAAERAVVPVVPPPLPPLTADQLLAWMRSRLGLSDAEIDAAIREAAEMQA